MARKTLGVYISINKGKKYYKDTPLFKTKKDALAWAYHYFPKGNFNGVVIKRIFTGDVDSFYGYDDDMVIGTIRWVKRKKGNVLIFEDEAIYWGDPYGMTYDVTATGSLSKGR